MQAFARFPLARQGFHWPMLIREYSRRAAGTRSSCTTYRALASGQAGKLLWAVETLPSAKRHRSSTGLVAITAAVSDVPVALRHIVPPPPPPPRLLPPGQRCAAVSQAPLALLFLARGAQDCWVSGDLFRSI